MLNEEIKNATEVLKNGGLILYPTDTIWGIGCDATNEIAIERIFKLKGRDSKKSLIVLLDNDNKLQSYVSDIPDLAYDLIEFAEQPLTIVYSKAKNLAKNVVHEDGTIGIRIVKHPFCEQLIQRFKKPVVSTSANLSGEPSPSNFSEIASEIISGVDYVVNLEQVSFEQKRPSTIMKLDPDGTFKFIRK